MLPEYSNLNPIFLEYANDVMSGAIVACNNIKLACKRYLDWFDRTDIEFRPEMVQKKIDFVNKMKHWQGPYAGKHFNLLPFQVWIFCNIFGWYYRETNKRVTRNVFIFVGRKNAKAISLDTNIPTPYGNRQLRDIHEGDIIFGADGKPTTVLQESEIYYNPCYKIVFENGEEIISADNHRWYVKHRKSQRFVVKTTQEMYDEGIYHQRKDGKCKEYNYRTLLTEPVQYKAKDYIVDPYVLGLWLGDGSRRAPKFVTQYKHDDYKIYDYVTKLYGEPIVYVDKRNNNVVTLRYNNTRINKYESKLSSDLIKIGVFHNKHIPSEYKYGSVEQRLSLIQGLMDTDGCCNKSGYHQCEITQKNLDIIKDMQEILSSLGIKSQIKTSYVTLNGKKCGPYYRLLFYADKTMPVFRMKRKYDRLPEQLHKRMKYNTIKDIIPCETVPCKCLMVDNDEHLFLCGNQYTVTHNTSMAAAISLACMCKDEEQGAEVNLIANNRKQALIAFEDCQNYARSLDPKHKYLTVYRDSIKFSKTNSKLQVLASDSMGLDGYRSHMFLIDEFHAAKTWDLYNVMKRSQGVQENPLAIIITTAGYLQSGYPCYDMRIACIDILRGFKHDDSQFSAIYELDEGDDWQDKNVWIKANPSLGIALREDAVQDYVTQAINVPSTLFDTLTKQFNIFMGSKNVWIKDKYILNSSVPIDLEDFRGETCYMGVDLSAVSDLTSWTVLFPPNPDRDKYPDKFVFKTFAYVPQEAMDSENGQKYNEWIQRGQLYMTSGNAVDYDKILLDQQNMIEQYELCCYKVSYDSYNATQYATNALSLGLPMEAFSQSLGSFNRPTKGFEILMLNDKVILDMNLVTKWCFQNAELKEDFNNNVKPIKPNNNQDKARKIDCVISIVQALGGFLIDQQYGYESTTATDSNE